MKTPAPAAGLVLTMFDAMPDELNTMRLIYTAWFETTTLPYWLDASACSS